MIFKKNQVEFSSEKHKDIWRCGVLILPQELSLSGKVRALIDADLFESCKQMRLFMLHSLSDMYENVERYQPTPKKYVEFWYRIVSAYGSGELRGEKLIFDADKWERLFATKMDVYYDSVFTNTGIQIKTDDKSVVIVSSLYPKMFRAMKEMAGFVRARKEKASEENSFHFCDFRKICPGYKYGKSEKRIYMREIEDRIPLLLAAEHKKTALEFVAYLHDKKIKLKWTGLQNNYNETGQTHINRGICYIGLSDIYQRGNKGGWLICLVLANMAQYEDAIISEGLQEFILNNIYYCDRTPVDACNGGEKSVYACHRGINLRLLNKEIEYVCRLRNRNGVSVFVHDPDEEVLEKIKRLVEFEIGAV